MSVIPAFHLVVLPGGSILAQAGPYPLPMHEGWWHGWWPMGGILWLALLALAAIGLVTVLRWVTGSRSAARPSSSALTILEERYARGEIDREEFESRRRDLIK